MAAEGSIETPIIVEPTASSKASPSPSLLTASPDPSSSSNSFESPRPESAYSNTSQSDVSPSPIEDPKDVSQTNPTQLASAIPPEIDPLPSPRTLVPTSQPINENSTPRSVPSNTSRNTSAPTTTTTSSRGSSFRSLRARLHERRWLETIIGALGLATALWLGVRGYKLAVWQSWNDLRQLCSNYQQVDHVPT